MNKAKTQGLLWALAGDVNRLVRATRAGLKGEGYRPWDTPLPPGYIAQNLEVKTFQACGDIKPPCLRVGDPHQVYQWAIHGSSKDSSLPLLAVYSEAFGFWSAKVYLDGSPLFKVGEDPDREVPYPVPTLSSRTWERVVSRLSTSGTVQGLEDWKAVEGAMKNKTDFLSLWGIDGVENGTIEDENEGRETWLDPASPLMAFR